MKNPEENPLRLNYFQTCFSHQLQRLSVPVTSELFRKPIRCAVLKPPQPFTHRICILILDRGYMKYQGWQDKHMGNWDNTIAAGKR
jgi:hypothetical protein